MFSRIAASTTVSTLLVLIAFQPGGVAIMETVLLSLAALVMTAGCAPWLPLLNRLPIVGAPKVTPLLSLEDNVLRVGFVNKGSKQVSSVLLNVCVPRPTKIKASDYKGKVESRGRAMPDTVEDGVPMAFWSEKLDVPVGGTFVSYRLKRMPAGGVVVRVVYGADGLYGGDRVVTEVLR